MSEGAKVALACAWLIALASGVVVFAWKTVGPFVALVAAAVLIFVFVSAWIRAEREPPSDA